MKREDLLFKGFPNWWKFQGDSAIDETVKFVYNFLWPLLAIVVISVMYSGIKYIMAGGDQQQAAAAKKNLIWGITGVVIILLAISIINFIPMGLNGALK